jgi:hypothetical protein
MSERVELCPKCHSASRGRVEHWAGVYVNGRGILSLCLDPFHTEVTSTHPVGETQR